MTLTSRIGPKICSVHFQRFAARDHHLGGSFSAAGVFKAWLSPNGLSGSSSSLTDSSSSSLVVSLSVLGGSIRLLAAPVGGGGAFLRSGGGLLDDSPPTFIFPIWFVA